MSWLRVILLVGGLLFIGVLIWLERRRPGRVQQDGELRVERSEPAMGFADDPGPPIAAPGASATLPPIDWSTPVTVASADPPLIIVSDIPASRAVPAAEAAPALRVEWPSEDQRQIVSLRVVAARQNRIAGRLLRQGLCGAGFQHGEFGIFHLGHSDGRVALSAASLVRPGLLDPAAMDFQSFSGVNLFAVLPGPLSNEETLERLTAVAAELAERVEGRVQDERGMPFDTGHTAAWRERAMLHLTGQAD